MRCRRFYLLLLSILLLASMLYAEDIDFSSVEYTTLALDIHSSFDLTSSGPHAKVSSATINLQLYPTSDFRQELLELDTIGVEDNRNIFFTLNNPSLGKHSFGYEAKVRVKNEFRPVSRKIHFPLREGYPFVDSYVSPTTFIDFHEDKQLYEVAKEIIGDDDDLYVIVYKLAKWITDNIDYNLSTAHTVEKASTTLSTRRGVCDEATILFISFTRSLGIPTKYISGLAYTNLDGLDDWGAHAWAEVYFEDFGWIPFDFTYRQYGFVDASHIKLKESEDANEPSVEYEWAGYNADLITSTIVMDTTLISADGVNDNPIQMSLRPLHPHVGPESYNVIEATVTNMKNHYYTSHIHLTKAPYVDGENDQMVLFKPLETKKLYWVVHADGVVGPLEYLVYSIEAKSQGFVAHSNFSLTHDDVVYSKESVYGDVVAIQKEDEFQSSTSFIFRCDHDREFYTYEAVEIVCSVFNDDVEQKNLRLCLSDERCETFSLDPREKKEKVFQFFIDEPRKYAYKATLENKNIYKTIPIEFESIVRPTVNISMAEKPALVTYDDWYVLKFRIERQETPKDVNITFFMKDYTQTWFVEQLDAPREYKLTLRADNLYEGQNPVSISVSYVDDNNNRYDIVHNDAILVDDMNFWQKVKYWLVSFVIKIEEVLS